MTGVVKGFLAISAADARRLAPAAITPFSAWTADDVRTYLAAAVRVSDIVSRRLNLMHALKDRNEAWWNVKDSPEQYWFGAFSQGKVAKLWWTFQLIARHLASPGLKVVCDASKSVYGMASPLIEKIWLGTAWQNPPSDVDADLERVQTFVHEAAHIAGRFSLAEGKNYGEAAAHALARYRMRATRNADNYGYYALDVAERPPLTASS